MKVKELIKELSKLDGDLDVRVFADHGQCYMPVGTLDVSYGDVSEYMLESVWDEDEYKEIEEEGETDLSSINKFVTIYD